MSFSYKCHYHNIYQFIMYQNSVYKLLQIGSVQAHNFTVKIWRKIEEKKRSTSII